MILRLIALQKLVVSQTPKLIEHTVKNYHLEAIGSPVGGSIYFDVCTLSSMVHFKQYTSTWY